MSGFGYIGGVTQADLDNYVPLAGAQMTGPNPLLLFREPVDPMEASTKSYVDTHVTGALNFIGVIDAATGNVRFTAASGLPPGPLPPAANVANDYVICELPGTIPGGPAAGITLAKGDWLASNGNAWYAIQVGQEAILASQVALIPPAFAANEVQTALTNAQTEVNGKVNKSGDTMTGGLKFGSATVATATDLNRHIALWGTTFGFSISGGTLNHVTDGAGAHAFMAAGTETARIASGGINLRRNTTIDGTLSMNANVRMSSPFNANVAGEAWPIDWYAANNYRLAQIVPHVVGFNLQAECSLKFRTMNGGWGWHDAMEFQVQSPPRTYCYGECSAANFVNRSDLTLKDDVRTASDTEAQIAFEGFSVIRYRWKEASDRRLRWGLNTDLLEITAPDAVEKISGKKHYDVGAVLAIVIAEVQRLRSLQSGQESQPVVKLPWIMRLRFRWVGLLQWIASRWRWTSAPPAEEPEAETVTSSHR